MMGKVMSQEQAIVRSLTARSHKLMGHRAEQLAQGRICGHPFAVSAGMEHQDAEIVEMTTAASDLFLFVDVADHRQGGSAGIHTDASFIWNHRKVGSGRKIILPLFDLHPITFRLILIGDCQDNVIPRREGLR